MYKGYMKNELTKKKRNVDLENERRKKEKAYEQRNTKDNLKKD